MTDPLTARLARAGIRPDDLEETFARSAGPGGQHVNKVSTAVTLRHVPSGVSVTVQDSRSQATNRKLARERLLDAIEGARSAARAALRAEREKIRRRNSQRPRAVKRRILEGKRKRSTLKKLRSTVGE
jgi:protein subunit release factor B